MLEQQLVERTLRQRLPRSDAATWEGGREDSYIIVEGDHDGAELAALLRVAVASLLKTRPKVPRVISCALKSKDDNIIVVVKVKVAR